MPPWSARRHPRGHSWSQVPFAGSTVAACAKITAPASGDAVVVSSYGSGGDGAFLLRCQDRGPAVDGSTLALWHLDETTGTSFADSSPNAYGGALGAGAAWAIDTGYSTAVCQ